MRASFALRLPWSHECMGGTLFASFLIRRQDTCIDDASGLHSALPVTLNEVKQHGAANLECLRVGNWLGVSLLGGLDNAD